MSTIINVVMHQENDFEIHSILTEEGVKIGYRKIGQGPGLILLHGGLQSSLNFTDLASAFICILKFLGDTSFSLLRSLPAFITVPMVNLLMRKEAKNESQNGVALRNLVPTFHHDRIIGRE